MLYFKLSPWISYLIGDEVFQIKFSLLWKANKQQNKTQTVDKIVKVGDKQLKDAHEKGATGGKNEHLLGSE